MVLAVLDLRKNWKKCSKHSKNLGVYFGYMGGKTPLGGLSPKIFLEDGIRDVITCFKFGDDRFRGLASADGQILPFPIDFDGRPYNTLTLPCERVISWEFHEIAEFTRQFSWNYCKTVRRRDIHLSKLNVAVCNTPHQSRKGQWVKWIAVIWLVTIT